MGAGKFEFTHSLKKSDLRDAGANMSGWQCLMEAVLIIATLGGRIC
jgi:hypothetical protein